MYVVQFIWFTHVSAHIPDIVWAQSYNHVTFMGPSKYQAEKIKIFQDITLCWLIFLHCLPSEMKALQLYKRSRTTRPVIQQHYNCTKGQQLHVQWYTSTTIVQKARNYMSSDTAALQLYKRPGTTHPVIQQHYNCTKGQELHVQWYSSTTIVQKARNYTSSDTAALQLYKRPGTTQIGRASCRERV